MTSDDAIPDRKGSALKLGLLGIAVMVAMVAGLGILMRDTQHHGQSLSAWVIKFQGSPYGFDAHTQPDVLEAMRAMGPVAHRRLLRSVWRQDKPWQTSWDTLCERLGPLATKLPRATKQSDDSFWLAYNARIVEILTQLLPGSIPTVMEGTLSSRAEVREVAIKTLGTIHDADAQVRSALLRGVTDPDELVQVAAILALRKSPTNAIFAVPALTVALQRLQTLQGNGPSVAQKNAAMALGDIGPAAREAVQAIKDFGARTTNSFGRIAAARALWKVDHNVADSLPVLRLELGAADPKIHWMILECLQEMGTNAASAIPEVKAAMRAYGPDKYFNEPKAHEALRVMEGIEL